MTEANGHVQELLDRYRTGELDPADHGRVESHLEGCEGCRSALAAMEAFATTVERAYATETTARATKREPDWGRLRASIVGRTSAREPGLRRSWLARHVPQTAALVVALVAVGVVWQQGIRAPGDADRGLRTERPAGSRADRAGGRSGGLERPGLEDRVTGAAAPEGGEVAPSEVSPDEVDAVQQGRVAAREAAPAAEAIGQDDMMAKAGAREGNTVSGAGLEARADSAAVAAEPEVADEIAVAAQEFAPAPPPDLERFQRRARLALSEADSALVAGALAQWRDSLAPGEELPADLRRAAEALADSLAAFLAKLP